MNAMLVALAVDDARGLAASEPDELIECFESGVDIENAWAAVGWLFLRCGLTHDPIIGGDDVIGEDFGYGPLTLFTPALVSDLATQMASITTDDLSRTLDLDELHAASTYPDVWDRASEADENRSWILDAAHAVAELYSSAAVTGSAIVTLIA